MAAVVSTGKQWRDFFEKNVHVPPAFDRQKAAQDVSTPICINLNNIDGVHGVEGAKQQEYQVYISLYDLGFRQFFGRQWVGPYCQATGQKKPKLKYNQNVYFHTSVHNSNIVAVVELVATTTGDDGKKKKVACGWGIIRPFGANDELQDWGRTANLPVQKLSLFYGSPRALYFMDDPIESNPLLNEIQDCSMSYTVGTHKALYKIMNLLPENVLVGQNDMIPGLQDSESPGKDQLKKPKMNRIVQCLIDTLYIQLPPDVEKFEEELCSLLHMDRGDREGRVVSGTQVSVVERRLNVGVHNGWCYVEKPETFHLDIMNENEKGKSLKPTASPSVRRSKKFLQTSQKTGEGGVTFLTLKNKIELNCLYEDPMCAIVFTLEYVIGEPLSDEDRRRSSRMSRGNTRTVTLRWASWNPFLQVNTPEVQLALAGGPSPAPDDEFIYKLPDTKMQNTNASKTAGGVLCFTWLYQAKDGSTVGSANQGFLMPGSMGSMQSAEGSEMVNTPAGMARPLSARSPSGFVGSQPSQMQRLRQPSMASLCTSEGAISSRTMQEQYNSGPMSLQVPQMMSGQQQGVAGQMMPQQGMMPQSYGMPQQIGPQGMMYPQGMPQQPMYGGPTTQGMYAMEISHMRETVARTQLMTMEMNELPFTPSHVPIVVQPQHGSRAQGLSRAAYARLYNAGFEPILDRNREPPEVLDPRQQVMVDLNQEIQDPLQCNEIIFQFLAFSRMKTVEATGPQTQSDTIFFTFQFYRCPQVTTERLMLSKPENELSSDQSAVPYILQRLEPDGSLSVGSPGLMVKYDIDPSFMKPGENALFLKHLLQQTLYVDVWDGESLLLMGTCAVDLKYLCRCGHEAVQTTFELDVITQDYESDPNVINSNLGQAGGAQPIGVSTHLKGKLHLRMANVGRPADPRIMNSDGLKLISSIYTKDRGNAPKPKLSSVLKKPHLVVSQIADSKTSFPGGCLTGPPAANSKPGISVLKKISKAKHLSESNKEVKALLFSQTDQEVPEKDENHLENSEKSRKIARLQAVRQAEGLDNKVNTILSYKTEKTERMRDYKTMEIYRMQTKKDGILNMLSQNITSEHTVHPAFGSPEFFEFKFKNPFNVEQSISVEFDDPELHLVTNAREWQYFRQVNGIEGQIEAKMFNEDGKAKYQTVFLRPKETVHIPFKYQTFTADESVQPQGPVDPFKDPKKSKRKPAAFSLQDKEIKVYFRSEDGKSVSILCVKLEPVPHVTNQTFRFYHPEQSFLKKSIRMPNFQSLPGAPIGGSGLNQVYIRCSNPHVICDSKPTPNGEPIDIFLKVALGPSPQIKRFYLAMYSDPFLVHPIQIWQFYVHALQRVDVSCIEGQTSRFALLLRGTQTSRLVKCYSSHPNEMQLLPNDQFMLAAGAVHELSVAIRPMKEGNKFFYLNVVDVEYHQMIRSWLVCVTCKAPMISRAFELVLPVGGGKGCSKKITYTNPYPHKKVFNVLTNREDLLQFKENRLEIEGGDNCTIGLRFTPVLKSGTTDLMVFINDEDDKNEETFRISAVYQ